MKRMKCPVCGVTTRSFVTMREHARLHGYRICSQCGKFLDDHVALTRHVRTDHATTIPAIKNLDLRPLDHQVLAVINDGRTRDELVNSLNTPRTTIYDALHRLMLAGKVARETRYEASQLRGRPRVMFVRRET